MINVSDQFHLAAEGQVINPKGLVRISFDKIQNGNATLFILDQSQLNGPDLLNGSEDNPIQLWDTYRYVDYTDRLIKMELARSITFPNTVQSAIADITLNNYDGYFDPSTSSPISNDNLPKRPVKLYAGYEQSEKVQQLVGLTQEMPRITNADRTVTYHIMDFLDEIGSLQLNQTIDMRDVTTDVVLASIVEQFGVLRSQYNFMTGRNRIPFVFFDKGQNAGEAINQLVQAEGGRMWLDSTGILRFQSRSFVTGDPVIELDDYSVIDVTPSGTSGMVNHVKVSADIREVQEYQTVYTKTPSGDSVSTSLWVIPPNGGTYTIDADLEDPCYDVVVPTQGKASSVSWFTAKASNGAIMPTGVTATGELTTNAYKITFTNNNVVPVEIDELVLWGEPAKVIDVIDYDSYDDVSVSKYGEQILEIADNPFFQSYRQVELWGDYILSEHANYNTSLELNVKGDFSLQIGDPIRLSTSKYPGTYIVDSVKYILQPGILTTNLRIHRYEISHYFILDKSQLNGPDVLA